MKTRTRTKVVTSIVAIILSIVLLLTGVLLSNSKNSSGQVVATSRTIELTQSAVDVQSVFNEFEDASLTREGSTVYFEGYKSLDQNALSEIDYISELEMEELAECVVKYNFSYNSETNIVTIAAMTALQDGSIEVDEITGVGFLNDKNEIDAVMNIDGEGVLLSEMRDAGLIENCGWFSRLIKNIAKAVAVVAVVAVAVAAVVVTAGAAAPAVVAAGVGVSTTVVAGAVATAATIGTYAAITAVIAAGIALTADIVEKYYPGCGATEEYVGGKTIVYASWVTATINCIKELTKNNNKHSNPEIYFECKAVANLPSKINLTPYDYYTMASRMSTLGKSCVTVEMDDAKKVISAAVPSNYPIFAEYNGLHHFHACNIDDPDYDANRDINNNPRYKVNGNTLHSFWIS